MKQFLVIKSISDIRQIKPASQITVPNGEGYTSLFYFDYEMIDHLDNTKSVSNFNGNVYGNYFVLDLDSPDIPKLIIALAPFLDMLKNNNIIHYIFFSGAKGFHIYIPKEYVLYPEELTTQWNVVCRMFAEEMMKTFPKLKEYIDLAIYDKVRMFRMPYSIHPKTGKAKSLLEYRGLNKEKPINSFMKLQRKKEEVISELFEGRKLLPHQINKVLTKLTIKDTPPTPSKNSDLNAYLDYPYGEKLCIYKMLNTRSLKGSRHNVALRLMSYWKEKGYNLGFTRVLMKEWNSELNEPLEDSAIDKLLEFYDKGYIFTCKDQVKAAFCVKSCHLYKLKDVEDNYLYTSENYIEKYKQELNVSRANWIYMVDQFSEWSLSAIKPGYVIVIAGGPGSGKTTFVLNMMMYHKHINWLFFSLEMTGVDIVEKLFKVTDTKIEDENSLLKFKEDIKHIITIDKPDISAESLKSYVLLTKAKTGKMPTAIVIDYLSLLGSRGNNQTERVIQIVKALKTLAKEMKLIVFILSQVPKDIAGDGNIPLGLNAPKDSGEIINLADMLWCIWRPNRNRGQMVDDVLTLGMPKNRHGDAGYTKNFKFTGSKYKVSSRYKQEE
jgi:nucleoside-triphosphatase THEP1